MHEPLRSLNISTRLERIAELAREHPERVFNSLHHAVDVEWLREAMRRTRKDASAGVDGQTAEQYAVDLEDNLERLLNHFAKSTYYAPPVRRVHIPKEHGRTRPIGIPTYEDKILQRAVLMVLEAVYEQDFHPGSYGFRPGRGAHQALDALWRGLMSFDGGWVLEADIQSYFDTIDHQHLRSFLDRRVTDGPIRRVVNMWLKAGVLEEGVVRHPETGTPQGGVISPLLANVYLHEVLDTWFERDVRPRLSGRSFLVRYADDFVLCFEREDDARRVQDVLRKRFQKYGLTLHPDKTRLVRFERPDGDDEHPPKGPTFDLLGFTHYWGKSRNAKVGYVIKRKTMRARLARAARTVWQWCKRHRHEQVKSQHAVLARKLHGHYGYYGVIGNLRALAQYARAVEVAWRYWLDRRSQRARMTWDRFRLLLEHLPLPPPRRVHAI